MQNRDLALMQRIAWAEAYLGRPLRDVERSFMETYTQDKPLIVLKSRRSLGSPGILEQIRNQNHQSSPYGTSKLTYDMLTQIHEEMERTFWYGKSESSIFTRIKRTKWQRVLRFIRVVAPAALRQHINDLKTAGQYLLLAFGVGKRPESHNED